MIIKPFNNIGNSFILQWLTTNEEDMGMKLTANIKDCLSNNIKNFSISSISSTDSTSIANSIHIWKRVLAQFPGLEYKIDQNLRNARLIINTQ